MTNSWTDIKNTDLVVIMGGYAAEAHPCGFKWVTEAKANRGAKLIVVDPRYTRSASVSDMYAPIRQGTDIAFINGLINYCIGNDKVQWDYVKSFTNAPYLVKDGFDFKSQAFVLLFKLIVHNAYDDIKATAELVSNSHLDWTLVRIPNLKDGPATGQVDVGWYGKTKLGMKLSRGNLAKFLVDQVAAKEFVRAAPGIADHI